MMVAVLEMVVKLKRSNASIESRGDILKSVGAGKKGHEGSFAVL